MLPFVRRLIAFGLLCAALSACTRPIEQEIAAQPIGDFSLANLVVVVNDPIKGPMSRELSDDQIEAAVRGAVQSRLGRFTGAGRYTIGIKVGGYVLARRGIPVLVAQKSILLMNVGLFDETGQMISGDWKRMTVFEEAGGDTIIGSGYSQTAEEQLAELANNTAIQIERWLRENADWVNGIPLQEASESQPEA